MAPRDCLLVVDIETVPDRERLPPGAEGFPKTLFHKIVAVSFLQAEISRIDEGERYHLTECRSGGRPGATEPELLAGFWTRFEKSQPRVVTWNGRSFDLPVLRQRAFLHGIPARGWYMAGDRWNNYGQRYGGGDWHCDLMDQLGDFGASKPLGLAETAQALGLPGKMGVDGSMVETLASEGRLDEVRAYCETDVLNLYLLYLRWGVLTGRLDPAGEAQARDDLDAYLETQGVAGRPHLLAFQEAWRAGRQAEALVAGTRVAGARVEGARVEAEAVAPHGRPAQTSARSEQAGDGHEGLGAVRSEVLPGS